MELSGSFTITTTQISVAVFMLLFGVDDMSAGGLCITPPPHSGVPQEQRLGVRLLCQKMTKLRWCHQRHLGTLEFLQNLVDSCVEGSWGNGKGRWDWRGYRDEG